MKNIILTAGLFVSTLCASLSAADLKLWYRQPATAWEREALPIGNGQMGAMFFGGVPVERIQFNEESLWIGDEEDTGAYQAFGDVFVNFSHGAATNYSRTLDLKRAVHLVNYASSGVNYRREAFASCPAKVIAFRFTADQPGALSGTVTLTDMHAGKISADGNRLVSSGSLAGYKYQGGSANKNDRQPYAIALQYEAQMLVQNQGGKVRVLAAGNNFTNGPQIEFTNCDEVTLLLAAGTDFVQDRSRGWRGESPHPKVTARIDAAAKRKWDDLLAEHTKDYQNLFDRVQFALGASGTDDLPTDERIERLKKPGGLDLGMESLFFQYGRYLLISSSRSGGLPANLQGKWNDQNNPAWRCDYHTDVNVEMNYWLADAANLSECFEPYADWINSIRAVRIAATQKEFHQPGWLMRGESGLFGGSTWDWTPGTSAWMLQNSYDHFRFTNDKKYLRDLAYPAMKEVCAYWLAALQPQPDGTLLTPTGLSPEHGPKEPGISFDQQLVWDLFNNTAEAAKVLGVDAGFAKDLENKRDHLLPPKIGRWGQLQEWKEDIDDPTDHHRHTSHLIAVYPGRQISVTETPALARAAAVSLDARGVTGDSCREWAFAWRMALWARLADGDKAHFMYQNLFEHGVLPNLFCTHPPFQMDGNFCVPASISEMLLQSQTDEIQLLPALPKVWPSGKVSGLRARGGCEVGIKWQDGKLASATIRNVSGDGKIKVRYGNKVAELNLKKGAAKNFDANFFPTPDPF